MPEPGPSANDLVRDNLTALLRACDIVFGSTSIALAVLGTWLCVIGQARAATAAGLWFIPAFNITWSQLSPRLRSARPDLLRNAISLPVATFLYVADPGVLERLWLSSLMLLVYASLSLGIASRRVRLGYLATLAYGLALAAAGTLRAGAFDFTTLRDALGLIVTGLVFSLVASHLGRSLDEAQRQRDETREQKERAETAVGQLEHRTHELTAALDSLHAEIAQRARVEVELRQAQKLESVGRLAAGVAHELNTPIQFVSDSVQFVREAVQDVSALVEQIEVLRRSIRDDAPLRAAALTVTETAADADLPYVTEHVPKAIGNALDGLGRIAAIVRSLKTFAYPDAKHMVAADLNQAIQSTLTMACHEYRYVAELETELGELPPVWCHLGELNQALLNIVINAAHAIGDVVAGTERKGRIHVRTHREGDLAVIAIADTGAGIPEGVRDHIFDPFFTTKPVGRGSGQGLSIARSVIVDQHGGQLALETEPGKGTTFFIRLPIHERVAAAAS
jgi:signal transduction histidine kinase